MSPPRALGPTQIFGFLRWWACMLRLACLLSHCGDLVVPADTKAMLTSHSFYMLDFKYRWDVLVLPSPHINQFSLLFLWSAMLIQALTFHLPCWSRRFHFICHVDSGAFICIRPYRISVPSYSISLFRFRILPFSTTWEESAVSRIPWHFHTYMYVIIMWWLTYRRCQY